MDDFYRKVFQRGDLFVSQRKRRWWHWRTIFHIGALLFSRVPEVSMRDKIDIILAGTMPGLDLCPSCGSLHRFHKICWEAGTCPTCHDRYHGDA